VAPPEIARYRQPLDWMLLSTVADVVAGFKSPVSIVILPQVNSRLINVLVRKLTSPGKHRPNGGRSGFPLFPLQFQFVDSVVQLYI